MKYENVVSGKFIKRPNRFIAHVDINGVEEICHVKNTGRCRELLVEGAQVWLEKSKNTARKTKYDLIAVKKGELLINMDSQAPNKAAKEFIQKYFPNAENIRGEVKYGQSRFDYYFESEGNKCFMEVKGVTLEENGIAKFPDAPTERGVKHINELCSCVKKGYKAYILFVIQMKGISCFTPNYKTHREFGETLKNAREKGVEILAVDCLVTPESMETDKMIEVKL